MKKSFTKKKKQVDVIDSTIKSQYKRLKPSTQETLSNVIEQTDTEKYATYVQKHKCNDRKFETGSINYCRECYISEFNESKPVDTECRFVGWRKLKKIPSGSKCRLVEAGFLQEDIDVDDENDLDMWQSAKSVSNQDMKSVCSNIFFDLKDSFQCLMENEFKLRDEKEKKTIWKRPIPRTRELCDQCSTSIFNGHFACTYCGFSVCFRCYELRKRNLVLISNHYNEIR
jgi:hypothetical protein